MANLAEITIFESFLDDSVKILEKLTKKARRYGCGDISYTVSEPFLQKRRIREKNVNVSMVTITVAGDAPRVGNYEFIARIEITKDGNLIDYKPGVTQLPEKYRDVNGFCEHCGRKRSRKEVFVCQNVETGEYTQIGRQCLRDFLGIDSPEHVLAKFTYLRELAGEFEDGHPRSQSIYTIEELLMWSSVAIRLFGWCSKGQAQTNELLTPTSSRVFLALRPSLQVDKYDREEWQKLHDSVTDEDRDVAQATIEFVRNELGNKSDYEHNLKVLFAQDVIADEKRMGLVVSAVSAYHRAKDIKLRLQQERTNNADSKHFGTVGERIRGLNVTVETAKSAGSMYGDVVLYKFRTEDGNVATWFGSSSIGKQIGEKLTIDATIKAHNEYKGVKETLLTRVKVK